jgi:hypothetical protein
MQRLFADRSFEQGRLPSFSWLIVLVLLAGISAYSVISLALERGHSDDLAAANQQLRVSLQQIRSELHAPTEKLNKLATQLECLGITVPS